MVLGLLALVSITHIGIGSRYIPPGKVLTALFAYNGADFDHRIIVHLRLLRLLAGIFAGAALGVAGVILQSIVRNPLGEPHILGLNAGASLAVVIGMVTGIPWLGSALGRPLVAMLGATILFSLVLGISCAGRGGPTPLKVTLCGVALSALAASLTSTLLLLDEQALLGLRLWLAGDLSGLGYQSVLTSGLFVAVGLLAGFVLSPRLNVMELGDIAAAGLGINLMRTRAAGLVIAALLCGAAVSIAGPIGFIGLVVPHLLRRFAGGDIRILAPGAAAAGACLLLGADMLARVVLAPQELATGVMTAIIGAPVFIVIAARFFR
jgi:iron complex transport system permease protein